MLGSRTQGGRMEGADKSTELWRHSTPSMVQVQTLNYTSCHCIERRTKRNKKEAGFGPCFFKNVNQILLLHWHCGKQWMLGNKWLWVYASTIERKMNMKHTKGWFDLKYFLLNSPNSFNAMRHWRKNKAINGGLNLATYLIRETNSTEKKTLALKFSWEEIR